MKNIGVVEGFFGPAWSQEDRLSYAEFLAERGGDFYIYAPKQDQCLRKGWRETWSADYLTHLNELKNRFQQKSIKFGVGLSPFGLGIKLRDEDKVLLVQKAKLLNSLGLDLIGLFFDDMPTNEKLAETQIETLKIIQSNFSKKIIFCPTYYTFDPILEKVFGRKPAGYLEMIASEVPPDVAIAWTGPKVISPEISLNHVEEVSHLLKRSPYIWENIFANDGPKNCKFLKLKPFLGRSPGMMAAVEGFAFNMMNQPQLSKILFLAAYYVLVDCESAESGLDKSLSELCSNELKDFINTYRDEFLNEGLDSINESKKEELIAKLNIIHEPMAKEISDWLTGQYLVGSECLTD